MPPKKKPAKKKTARKKFDNRFRAIYDKSVKWQEGAAVEMLTLPKGVKVKIFAHDPVMQRIDMKVKFPKGYVEPAHTHKSWHSILVTKGRMCVAGKDLRPGDYVFGWDLPHGPYEYPDGCEVFTVFMGGGTQHIWDGEKHLRHRTKWKAKTSAGKKAVKRGAASRERALSRLKSVKKKTVKKKAARKRTAKKK
ncbi:cupin domain-containing protein [Nitrospinota bacterium]